MTALTIQLVLMIKLVLIDSRNLKWLVNFIVQSANIDKNPLFTELRLNFKLKFMENMIILRVL